MEAITATEAIPEVEGVEHRFVDVDGLKMHVAVAGQGEPLVLLHGWPQHWYLWRNVIGPLAEHFQVFAPDLRGFGWTDAPKSGYDKRELADDVLKLLDVLELDRVKLVGHDWGGFAGFILAMKHPERVERYMALNIPPPWTPPQNESSRSGKSSGIGTFVRNAIGELGALRKLWYQVPLSTPGVNRWLLAGGGRKRFTLGVVKATKNRECWKDGSLDVFIDQFADPKRQHSTMMLYRTFLTREVPALGQGKYVRERLTVPTRMLFGADDVAVSRESIEADHSHKADDLTAEIVENCGHFIVDEQPELVAQRIIEWNS